MAQDPDLLTPNLDRMIELAAVAWQSPPAESVRLLHSFQAANRTLRLIVLTYQHVALLTRAVEAGTARRRNEPLPPEL
jgi:hypothetical protein